VNSVDFGVAESTVQTDWSTDKNHWLHDSWTNWGQREVQLAAVDAHCGDIASEAGWEGRRFASRS
jgi:hypothetical protein